MGVSPRSSGPGRDLVVQAVEGSRLAAADGDEEDEDALLPPQPISAAQQRGVLQAEGFTCEGSARSTQVQLRGRMRWVFDRNGEV